MTAATRVVCDDDDDVEDSSEEEEEFFPGSAAASVAGQAPFDFSVGLEDSKNDQLSVGLHPVASRMGFPLSPASSSF